MAFHLGQGVGLDHQDRHHQISGLTTQGWLTTEAQPDAQKDIGIGQILHRLRLPTDGNGWPLPQHEVN